MAGRIPQQFIDDLVSRIDIVEVIDSRVPLKKKGREYMACCPFHNEKTPSFSVSPAKQFYHCFGCGAHGTAIGFLMEFEHMEFVEAVEELASMAGVEVPRESGPGGEGAGGPARRPGPDLYELLETCDSWYRRQLRQHPQAQRAVDYLKRRGLSGEIAAEFGIGYAPPGWDNLLKTFGDTPERRARLTEAGMLIEKDDGRHYDRFRDRVMFPIRDRRGRTIAFGGRVLGEDTPKYLNSPETPVFHKGRELYGLYEARKALRDIPRLVVVEGYMDVVSLAQFDIRYAVATLGTSTTHEHLERLFRITPEVVFCFDGDRAGREAAWRALENALPAMHEGRQLSFMFLPEGQDPDTYVREIGRDGFEAAIAKAVPFSNFFIEGLSNRTDISTRDGRARLVALARPLLSRLPPGVFRHMMVARLAEIALVPAAEVERLLTGAGAGGSAQTAPQTTGRRPSPPGGPRSGRTAPSLVRTAVAALLQRPALAGLAGEPAWLADLDMPGVDLLREMIELLQAHPHLGSGALLEHWRETDHGRALQKLAASPLLDDSADLDREFQDALARLRTRLHEQRYDALLAKLALGAELTPEEREEFHHLPRLIRGGTENPPGPASGTAPEAESGS
ncbi:MAG TPA: DNA primase [Gammaproteobacteria bacterium]|nr:DNA primase [Gammaproteobacteria bacterium]